MQKDLHDGVREGTDYIKNHDNVKRQDIDTYLNSLKLKYSLKELKLVVDKNNEDESILAHIRGEVNPIYEGPIQVIKNKYPEDTLPLDGKFVDFTIKDGL